MKVFSHLFLLLTPFILLQPWALGDFEGPQIPAVSRDKMARLAPAALKLGERLLYEGSLAQGENYLHVGHAELSSSRGANGHSTLRARARGARLGYVLDNRLMTILDENGLPILHRNEQQGTERRHKKIEFSAGGARFAKLKHCNSAGCNSEKHMVDAVDFVGIIPWGTKSIHCKEKNCTHREHYSWQYLKDHQFEGPYFDLLSAVFVARGLQFEVGGPGHTIAVVSDKELWIVEVRALKSEVLKVKAGEFDSLCLALEPKPAPGTDAKARFEGLFGLQGSLRIWIEKTSGRPILIEGDLPFAFLDFKARIELMKIQVIPSATVAPASARTTPQPGANTVASGTDKPASKVESSSTEADGGDGRR